MGKSRESSLWLLLATGLLMPACGGEPDSTETRETAFDLVQIFPSATVNQPTGLIDLGQPEARRFLISGWHTGHRKLDGGGIGTWSVGERAELEFFVAEPTDLRVSFRCAAIGRNTAPPRLLRLSINGKDWERIELARGLKDYELILPRELLRRGLNRFLLENPIASAGERSAIKDLRVLWDYVDFGMLRGLEESKAFARLDQDALFIPFGTRIDYYLERPSRAWLSATSIRGRGSPDGQLVVTWETAGSEETVLTENLSAMPDLEVPIPGGDARRGRLALLATSLSAVDPERPAGIHLQGPRILALKEEVEHLSEPESARSRPDIPRDRPNIIIYMVDTLRADHLGAYGYPKDISPRIDEFARESVLFANAQAQSPWTRASVASLFTGLWPQVHGAKDDKDKLADSALTLAERLRELGYRTAAITGNGNANGPFGFAQGFDYFKYLADNSQDDPLATSEDIHQAVLEWLELHASAQPFLLYVHTIDPHAPYDPPERHRSRWAPEVDDVSIGSIEAIGKLGQLDPEAATARAQDLLALYDAEVAYTDESFGRLLDELRARHLYDDSLVVFLSDHGEEFFDHGGWTHGKTLYSEMLDVPLIVKLPDGVGAGKKISGLAEHIDLMPTILDLIASEVPAGIQGRSLLPMILTDDTGDGSGDWGLANVALRGIEATSLIDGDWKIILRHESGESHYPELYARRDDPRERQNLAPANEIVARFFAQRLAEIEEATEGALEQETIDEEAMLEVREQLRALGYIQ